MIYSQNMKVDITFLVATVAALYGIWRSYRATNRIHSCKVVIDVDNSKVDNLNVNVKDGLSELPDGVLLDILSYLSLRDVARMAVLSKRWRNLCLTIPSLDLDWFVLSGNPNSYRVHSIHCEQLSYKQAYVKSVDQVLQNYKGQNILSFTVTCCLDKSYTDDVDRWINFAATNTGLHSLTLHFICMDRWRGYFQSHCKGLHLINGSFLSQFSNLRHLRLDSCILKLENDFIVPRNLTTLHLTNITLEGMGILDILSSCSTVECLRLRRCNLPDKLEIGNNFPRLRSLLIGECPSLQEFELSAKNLKKLEIFNDNPLKCTFKNVSNLESVYMCLGSGGGEDMLKSLAAETKIKYLILRGKNPLVNKLPFSPHKTFHSVLKLYISSADDDGSIVPALPCLLKSFPLLEKLEMRFPTCPGRQSSELLIPYVHKNLKEIKLTNFHTKWIPVAIYLLQSVFMLDCMVITKTSKGYSSAEPWNWSFIEKEFNPRERIIILNSLIGKASSTSARVTLE